MNQSEVLFKKAQKLIPGGVNSPVRAFKSVGGTPRFFTHGQGAIITDADNQDYIDYVGSWGPMILGHQDQDVIAQVHHAVDKGLSFGAPTEIETELAQVIVDALPSVDLVRMVNSGTEATMTAIRIARGVTHRPLIIKFEGCYHGHSDSLLIKAGSGALTLGHPSSPGIPSSIASQTLNLTFNDLDEVHAAFKKFGQDIAGIIVEPVAGNMNCILPQPGFLEGLRELCTQYGALLIFDEVMTGFRVAWGGAQCYYNIKPDLTTLGKIIGGGMPVGAIGGAEEYLSQLAPLGPIYQAGTLSGNPVTMAAGLATLNKIKSTSNFYSKLAHQTDKLMQGLSACAEAEKIDFQTNHVPGMFGLFFCKEPVNDYQTATQANQVRFNQFFHGMLAQGIYLAPSAFEAGFISIKHDDEIINRTLEAARQVFSQLT